MKGAGWAILALAIGFAAGVFASTRGGEGSTGVDPALRDSLALTVSRIVDLEEARLRAVDRAREDSIALDSLRRRIRIVPRPAVIHGPGETGSAEPEREISGGDTVRVYEVPPPVAEYVTRLERRVVSLETVLDTTTLALHAERNARKLAQTIAEQAERALEWERRRRWRYRLEGAIGGGTVTALAVILILL